MNMLKVDIEFLARMKVAEDFNASACINCGVCTAFCPMDIKLLPRHLFRYVLMGAREKVLESTSDIFSCLLCGMCEDNCPGEVKITANVRELRTYINREVYGLSRS
jgi:heterodisulfide reductase subunit C